MDTGACGCQLLSTTRLSGPGAHWPLSRCLASWLQRAAVEGQSPQPSPLLPLGADAKPRLDISLGGKDISIGMMYATEKDRVIDPKSCQGPLTNTAHFSIASLLLAFL